MPKFQVRGASEKSEMIRTLIISGALFIVFLIFAIGFWSNLDYFKDILVVAVSIHQLLRGFLKVFVLTGFYFFALVFVATLREYFNEVAGWFEVISLMLITVGLAYGFFGPVHAFFVFIGCVLGTGYIYLAQSE